MHFYFILFSKPSCIFFVYYYHHSFISLPGGMCAFYFLCSYNRFILYTVSPKDCEKICKNLFKRIYPAIYSSGFFFFHLFLSTLWEILRVELKRMMYFIPALWTWSIVVVSRSYYKFTTIFKKYFALKKWDFYFKYITFFLRYSHASFKF